MSDLKPCPFCGGEARTHYVKGYELWEVSCGQCGSELSAYLSEAEAIEAWNRRVVTDTNVGSKERTAKVEDLHGKWQRRKGSDCWECSQCHAVLENDDLGMHNFYFCYHCGANMMNKSGYMDIEEVHYG